MGCCLFPSVRAMEFKGSCVLLVFIVPVILCQGIVDHTRKCNFTTLLCNESRLLREDKIIILNIANEIRNVVAGGAYRYLNLRHDPVSNMNKLSWSAELETKAASIVSSCPSSSPSFIGENTYIETGKDRQSRVKINGTVDISNYKPSHEVPGCEVSTITYKEKLTLCAPQKIKERLISYLMDSGLSPEGRRHDMRDFWILTRYGEPRLTFRRPGASSLGCSYLIRQGERDYFSYLTCIYCTNEVILPIPGHAGEACPKEFQHYDEKYMNLCSDLSNEYENISKADPEDVKCEKAQDADLTMSTSGMRKDTAATIPLNSTNSLNLTTSTVEFSSGPSKIFDSTSSNLESSPWESTHFTSEIDTSASLFEGSTWGVTGSDGISMEGPTEPSTFSRYRTTTRRTSSASVSIVEIANVTGMSSSSGTGVSYLDGSWTRSTSADPHGSSRFDGTVTGGETDNGTAAVSTESVSSAGDGVLSTRGSNDTAHLAKMVASTKSHGTRSSTYGKTSPRSSSVRTTSKTSTELESSMGSSGVSSLASASTSYEGSNGTAHFTNIVSTSKSHVKPATTCRKTSAWSSTVGSSSTATKKMKSTTQKDVLKSSTSESATSRDSNDTAPLAKTIVTTESHVTPSSTCRKTSPRSSSVSTTSKTSTELELSMGSSGVSSSVSVSTSYEGSNDTAHFANTVSTSKSHVKPATTCRKTSARSSSIGSSGTATKKMKSTTQKDVLKSSTSESATSRGSNDTAPLAKTIVTTESHVTPSSTCRKTSPRLSSPRTNSTAMTTLKPTTQRSTMSSSASISTTSKGYNTTSPLVKLVVNTKSHVIPSSTCRKTSIQSSSASTTNKPLTKLNLTAQSSTISSSKSISSTSQGTSTTAHLAKIVATTKPRVKSPSTCRKTSAKSSAKTTKTASTKLEPSSRHSVVSSSTSMSFSSKRSNGTVPLANIIVTTTPHSSLSTKCRRTSTRRGSSSKATFADSISPRITNITANPTVTSTESVSFDVSAPKMIKIATKTTPKSRKYTFSTPSVSSTSGDSSGTSFFAKIIERSSTSTKCRKTSTSRDTFSGTISSKMIPSAPNISSIGTKGDLNDSTTIEADLMSSSSIFRGSSSPVQVAKIIVTSKPPSSSTKCRKTSTRSMDIASSTRRPEVSSSKASSSSAPLADIIMATTPHVTSSTKCRKTTTSNASMELESSSKKSTFSSSSDPSFFAKTIEASRGSSTKCRKTSSRVKAEGTFKMTNTTATILIPSSPKDIAEIRITTKPITRSTKCRKTTKPSSMLMSLSSEPSNATWNVARVTQEWEPIRIEASKKCSKSSTINLDEVTPMSSTKTKTSSDVDISDYNTNSKPYPSMSSTFGRSNRTSKFSKVIKTYSRVSFTKWRTPVTFNDSSAHTTASGRISKTTMSKTSTKALPVNLMEAENYEFTTNEPKSTWKSTQFVSISTSSTGSSPNTTSHFAEITFTEKPTIFNTSATNTSTSSFDDTAIDNDSSEITNVSWTWSNATGSNSTESASFSWSSSTSGSRFSHVDEVAEPTESIHISRSTKYRITSSNWDFDDTATTTASNPTDKTTKMRFTTAKEKVSSVSPAVTKFITSCSPSQRTSSDATPRNTIDISPSTYSCIRLTYPTTKSTTTKPTDRTSDRSYICINWYTIFLIFATAFLFSWCIRLFGIFFY